MKLSIIAQIEIANAKANATPALKKRENHAAMPSRGRFEKEPNSKGATVEATINHSRASGIRTKTGFTDQFSSSNFFRAASDFLFKPAVKCDKVRT